MYVVRQSLSHRPRTAMKRLVFSENELRFMERLLTDAATDEAKWTPAYRKVWERLLARVMEARKDK